MAARSLVAAALLLGSAAAAATRQLSLTLVAQNASAHPGGVRAVSFVGGSGIVSGGDDSLVKRWASADLAAQEPQQPVPHIVYDLGAAPDGSVVASGEGGWNGNAGSDTLRLWAADLGQLLNSTRPAVGYVYSVVVGPANLSAPGRRRVAASGFAGDIAIYVYDAQTSALELEATIATGKKRTFSLAFSPDGELLASASQKGQVQLWRTGSLQLAASLPHSAQFDASVAFSPDGSRLASGTDKGLLKVWSVATFQELASRDAGIGGVYSVSFSASGAEVAAAGDSKIRVFDAATLGVLAEAASAHAGRVLDVAFEPLLGSGRLASGGRDGALKLWALGGAPRGAPPAAPEGCSGLEDSEGAASCQRELHRCPVHGGSLAQCERSCCCEESPSAAGCPAQGSAARRR